MRGILLIIKIRINVQTSRIRSLALLSEDQRSLPSNSSDQDWPVAYRAPRPPAPFASLLVVSCNIIRKRTCQMTSDNIVPRRYSTKLRMRQLKASQRGTFSFSHHTLASTSYRVTYVCRSWSHGWTFYQRFVAILSTSWCDSSYYFPIKCLRGVHTALRNMFFELSDTLCKFSMTTVYLYARSKLHKSIARQRQCKSRLK